MSLVSSLCSLHLLVFIGTLLCLSENNHQMKCNDLFVISGDRSSNDVRLLAVVYSRQF